MKPFRGHISCAVLISLLVIIIVVVIKNENNKIIKPHRRRPTDSGTKLEIGQVERSGNRQSTALSVQKAKLLNFVPASNFKCVSTHFNFPAWPTHVSGPNWGQTKYTKRKIDRTSKLRN